MIFPSILASDFSDVQKTIQCLEQDGVKGIHFDVMDGHFVPNLTFGAKLIQDSRKHSQLFFDAHLMVSSPEFWLKDFIEAKIQLFTFHLEAIQNPETIPNIKETLAKHHILMGISIKPETPWQQLIPFLEITDLVLVMSVNPGFSKQKFIPMALETLSKLHQYRKENNLNYLLQIDGGVNESNMIQCYEYGADILVLGWAYFSAKNPSELLKKEGSSLFLKQQLKL